MKPIINPQLFNQLKKEIENGKWIEDRERLCIADKEGWTIAHEQASKGWVTEDKEILKLTEKKEGWTVAYIQAKRGWITEDKEILKLTTAWHSGYRTVAHEQVKHGWITEDKEILKLADNWNWTVAHEQAKNGWITEDKEILKLADKDGWTVAHEQVEKGWTTEDKEILRLATKSKGWTVAHEQAYNEGVTEDKEILKLADNYGWTVAHEQAKRGWITSDKEILILTDKDKISVYETILQYWNKVAKDPNTKLLLDEKFVSLLAVVEIGKKVVTKRNLKNKYNYLFEYLNSRKQFNQKISQKINNFVLRKNK